MSAIVVKTTAKTVKSRAKLNMPTVNTKRLTHILKILNDFDAEHLNNPTRNIPLDLWLRYYFLQNKAVQAIDREAIADYVYTLMRWKEFLNVICKKPQTWELRMRAFGRPEFLELLHKESVPPHIRGSCPEDLFKLFERDHGPEEALKICHIMNERPRLTVRANTLRTTRRDLKNEFDKLGWDTIPTKFAPNGLRFVTRPEGNFFLNQ